MTKVAMQTIQCLGFIMDGNRRWAKENNLPTLEGHKRGMDVFFDSVDWVRDAGIPNAVYYAFSTENWRRTKEEVSYLMDLFQGVLNRLESELTERNVRVRFIGQREDFSPSMAERMNLIEQKSLENKLAETTIWVALSYGGRAEIMKAVNQSIENGVAITEDDFSRLLWTADLPDADLIVRTSGEQRLSNFLTWRSVYSELLFIEKHWPALTKTDFENILAEYQRRERRKGV